MSLTLRSGRDGRFLARVIDQGGRPFVLDFGDPQVIADIVQRITRGFSVIRQGRVLHVHAGDPDLLAQLGAFYASEGALVFLEEPTWHGRRSPIRQSLPRQPSAAPGPELSDEDDPTETVGLSDLPDVDEALTTLLPEVDADPGCVHQPAPDLPAEEEPESLLPRVPRFED